MHHHLRKNYRLIMESISTHIEITLFGYKCAFTANANVTS